MTIVPGSVSKNERFTAVERSAVQALYRRLGRRQLAWILGTTVPTLNWMIGGYGGRVRPAKLEAIRARLRALPHVIECGGVH